MSLEHRDKLQAARPAMMAPQDATATDIAAKRAATSDDPPLVSFISLFEGPITLSAITLTAEARPREGTPPCSLSAKMQGWRSK